MARPNRGRSIGGESNLARRIAHERGQRGLSYEGLAKLMTDAGCGIQGSAIYKVEKAEPRRRVTVDELVALAAVFELSVDELLTPMEVLENRRAQELLREMDEADEGFFLAVGRLLFAFSEFIQLAESAPELYEFVHGHRFARPGSPDDGGRLRAPTTSLILPDIPGHDWSRFLLRVFDLYQAVLDEAGRLGPTITETNKKKCGDS